MMNPVMNQGVLKVLEEVERWLADRSWSAADRPLGQLLSAKRAAGTTVSVVLPALNEEATVGAIVEVIRRDLIEGLPVPLVDELVVIDSGSTDRTAEVAAKAGARVVHRDEVLPRIPAVPGKGEVLWRSLLVTTGDIVCFVDADLRDFSAAFVSGIVGPLLTDPDVRFVKAMYDRPFGQESGDPAALASAKAHGQGGRVTELVARPCSTSTGRSWPASSSRWAASTPCAASCWSGCRSRWATGWSWACWWTHCTRPGSTRWPRWTWAYGCTATRTARPWGGWPRRSTARRRYGSRGGTSYAPS